MTPRDDERRKFEAWQLRIGSYSTRFVRDENGDYENTQADLLWRGWLARAEQAETPSDAWIPSVGLGLVGEQLRQIPILNAQGWNRYDTDAQHVLHVWADGKSYDVRVPREQFLHQSPKEQAETPRAADELVRLKEAARLVIEADKIAASEIEGEISTEEYLHRINRLAELAAERTS